MPTPSEFSGYEFAAGKVVGARAFKVDLAGRLTGCSYEKVWVPGENIAKCYSASGPNAGVFSVGGPINARNYIGAIGGGGGGGGRAKPPPPTVGSTVSGAPGTVVQVAHDPVTNSSVLTMSDGSYVMLINGYQINAQNPPTPTAPTPLKEAKPHDLSNCTCGFYAYYDGSNDYGPQTYGYAGRVSGIVEGYGLTVIGSRGFRASKAKIIALCLPGAADPERLPKKEKKGGPIKRLIAWQRTWPGYLLMMVGCGIPVGGTSGGLPWGLSLLVKGHLLGGLAVLAGAALLGVFAACAWVAEFGPGATAEVVERRRRERESVPSVLAEAIRRNYPGVPIFPTFESMIAAFPPDTDAKPSPTTVANFWME